MFRIATFFALALSSCGSSRDVLFLCNTAVLEGVGTRSCSIVWSECGKPGIVRGESRRADCDGLTCDCTESQSTFRRSMPATESCRSDEALRGAAITACSFNNEEDQLAN